MKEIADRLFLILRDRVKMREYNDDNDMLVDMHHRIAQGYMNAPDLRLATFEVLRKLHFSVLPFIPVSTLSKTPDRLFVFYFGQTKNWVEAAWCNLHSAALVSQCLRTMHAKHHKDTMKAIPHGAKAFKNISENLLEEEASTTEGEGIGESDQFSEKGLQTLLEQSIHFLRKVRPSSFRKIFVLPLICMVVSLLGSNV